MSEEILVPVLGESLNEATVSKWLKNVGDFVKADEAIVELETDKVNLEVPASISGVLAEININEGQTVKVGSVLGVISDSVVKTNEKIKSKNTHGTGCTLSSAIATHFSCGKSLKKSCENAIKYVNQAIKNAPKYGKGYGPVNHLNSIHIKKKFR